MKALDVAVQSIAQRTVDPMERQRYIGLLESMAQDCESAIDLWQQVLKQPALASTNSGVLMHGTGPVLAKKLFDVHLEFRSKMLVITDYRGNLEDPVIPSAYHLLKAGETGTSYAQSALEQVRAALLAVQAHIETIRTTVPKKAVAAGTMQKSGKKVGPKKAVAKKSVTKKGVPKPVAKKKPAVKKPTVKKAMVKSVTKKKAVVKKPAVKKAVKKKTKKK